MHVQTITPCTLHHSRYIHINDGKDVSSLEVFMSQRLVMKQPQTASYVSLS